MIDVERIIEKGIKRAEELGATEVEILVIEDSTVDILATRKGIESIRRGTVLTADVRVAVGKKVTVQGAVISSENEVLDLVEKTVSIAKVVPEDPNWVSLPKNYGYTQVYDIVDDKVKVGDIEFLSSVINEALSLPSQVDRRAFANEVSVEAGVARKWLGNSYTSKAVVYEKTSFNFYINVKAVEEGYESSFYKFYSAPTLREFDLESLAKDATSVAIATIKAKPVETGKYIAVFTPYVFAAILRTLLVPAVRADQVQKNRSPLAKKLFTKVLSENLTIIDDGAAPNMAGSAPFDDEGVPTKRKTVIDKGVLITYLYDTYTAYIDGQESTGNAVRFGLGSPPMPSATNIIVIPGTRAVEDIIKDAKEVIVIYRTIGEWLSNPVNGNLGATVTNAIYYKNGEPVQAVKGITISGNIYSLFNEELVAVSREVELVGSMLVPHICVKDIAVAGEKQAGSFS
ncbi:MAG: TldD/PmbA family protein [Ignisphaera sp.]